MEDQSFEDKELRLGPTDLNVQKLISTFTFIVEIVTQYVDHLHCVHQITVSGKEWSAIFLKLPTAVVQVKGGNWRVP
jgi:hypothetical protein